MRIPYVPRSLGLLLTLALLPLAAVAEVPGGDTSTDAAAVQASAAVSRTAQLSLELESRTFNVATNNWTIKVLATLDSNYACVPLIFNCIVGELTDPPNADLVDLECLTPLWSHLILFRNHCLKEIGHAGQDAEFRFTYRTDPGVTTGTVTVSAEFGRGVLPIYFQQLAAASLVVDLDTSLELTKDCPTTVDSGDPVNCTISVSYPFSSGPAIPATIVDTPDGTHIVGGTLTQAGGTPSWVCVALTCSATVNPGESATFDYAGSAAATATGGDGSNTVEFTLGGTASVTEEIQVVGTGDAYLTIAKSGTQPTVQPGSPVSWTVTLTNTGGSGGSSVDATDVELADTAPLLVSGATMTYTSGVGSWTCAGLVCNATGMPVGTATFTVTGTLSADAPGGTVVVNDVGVTWFNDIFGPDFAETAGAAFTVAQSTTTTTTTSSTSTTTTTTAAPTSTTAAPASTTTSTPSSSYAVPVSFTG